MTSQSINVLLIEDDPDARRLVERTLFSVDNGIKYTLDIANDLKTAQKTLRCKDFDSVLLDLHLPDSTGLDTLSAIKKVNPDVPIIVLSAISDHETGIRAIQHGADYYLVKGQFMREMLGRSICFSIARRQSFERQSRDFILSGQSEQLKAELAKAAAEHQNLQGKVDILRKKFDNLLNSIPAMVWLKDLNGKVIAANKKAADFLKTSMSQLDGKESNDIFYDILGIHQDDEKHIIESGQPLQPEIVKSQPQKGFTDDLSVDRVPYLDDDGNVAGVLVFVKQISKENVPYIAEAVVPEAQEPDGHVIQSDDICESPNKTKKIMIVENDPLHQMLLNLHLNNFGFDIVTVDNGQKAVDRVKEEQFDLILMDIRMPVLNGYEATREIRSLGFDTPVIAVTADVVDGARKRCLDAGFDDLLSKPLIKKEFYNMVGDYLGIEDMKMPSRKNHRCIEI